MRGMGGTSRLCWELIPSPKRQSGHLGNLELLQEVRGWVEYFTALTLRAPTYVFSTFFLFLLLCFHLKFSVLITAYFSYLLFCPTRVVLCPTCLHCLVLFLTLIFRNGTPPPHSSGFLGSQTRGLRPSGGVQRCRNRGPDPHIWNRLHTGEFS